jgi:hypothetical protein
VASGYPYFSLTNAPELSAVDTKALVTLANQTGGETFLVPLDDKGDSLKRAATAIANKIGNQYIVGFIGDGSTNQLRIEASQHKEMIFKIESPKS